MKNEDILEKFLGYLYSFLVYLGDPFGFEKRKIKERARRTDAILSEYYEIKKTGYGDWAVLIPKCKLTPEDHNEMNRRLGFLSKDT